ncbi:hypothetical protein [Halobacterium yunchengense]|uniref:hypothetical protein n=1 Tax=Halobacterium yunchengense TaxID=3108497 RepID=UPI00300A4087
MDLSRRQLLGAVAGAGSAALVGVTALSSNAVAYEQTATVGSDPTVRVDWRETYNGAVREDGDEDADGPVLHVGNAQPGDSGSLAFRVRPETGGGARVLFSLAVTENAENGRNEPERAAGDETPDRGELGDALDVAVWYDTGSFGVPGLGACDGDRDTAESTLVDGSLLDADAALADGVRLGGDCLASDDGVCVGVEWALPATAGNRIQGDSVATDLAFTVEPCDPS